MLGELNIIGMNDIMLISNPNHIINHEEEEIIIRDLVNKEIKDKIKVGEIMNMFS
jgi:hypothetical protein